MKTLIAIIALLIILMVNISAEASTPTPSPTVPPVQATGTSASVYLRSTPTNIPVTPLAFSTFDAYGASTIWTDNVISIYHTMNENHIIDIVLSVTVILLIIYLIIHNVGSEISK